ncbi:MAG: hypothetical protein Q8O55_12920 [Dehalococcoidales bacterium]|nr:hypothetical protein [Dehalococcoidales bacterium]
MVYKQVHPRANLSIERFTERVPADGKYYLIKGDEVIESFRSLKLAQERYRSLVDKMALPPLIDQEKKMTKEQIQDLNFSVRKITGYEYTSKPSGKNKHPK